MLLRTLAALEGQYQQVIQIVLSDDLVVVDAVLAQFAVAGWAEPMEQPQCLNVELVKTLFTEVSIGGKSRAACEQLHEFVVLPGKHPPEQIRKAACA